MKTLNFHLMRAFSPPPAVICLRQRDTVEEDTIILFSLSHYAASLLGVGSLPWIRMGRGSGEVWRIRGQGTAVTVSQLWGSLRVA